MSSPKPYFLSNIVFILVKYNQLFLIQIICIGVLYLLYKTVFRKKEAYFWLNLEKAIIDKKASLSGIAT
jgi:hypothetical protein